MIQRRQRVARSSLFLSLCLAAHAQAQVSTTPQQGLAEHPARHYSVVDAAIVVAPGQRIERGSVEIKDGLIVDVRAGRHAAPGATLVEAAGKTIYPAFIDIHGSYGIDASARCRSAPAAGPGGGGGGPRRGPFAGGGSAAQTPAATGARHWNDRVCPERDVSQALVLGDDAAQSLRRLGFAASVAAPAAGVLRGQAALLSLRDAPTAQQNLLAPSVLQLASFEADFSFGGVYPGSKMGAIALIRQALYDARWMAQLHEWQQRHPGERAEANAALDALQPVLSGKQPLLFDADDELDVVRAARIAKEFGLQRALVLGIGTEYRVLDQLPAGIGLVLPLNFPAAPKVEDAESALELNLAELEHWRYAPYNPRQVAASGHEFALTLSGLDKPDEAFWPALRKAVQYGLSRDQALAALTTTPAAWLGESARMGRVAKGQMANLIVADADLFSGADAQIFEVYVDGERDIVRPLIANKITGSWAVNWAGVNGPANLIIDGEPGSLKLRIGEESGSGKLEDDRLLLNLPAKLLGGADSDRALLEATLTPDRLDGRWLLADGRVRSFSATRSGDAPAADTKSDGKPEAPKDAGKAVAETAPPPFPSVARYPAGEYGRTGLPPEIAALVIRDATVWMTGADQPLEHIDVLVQRGKIRAVGAALAVPAGTQEIQGSGLHLTPGLIDAHSHIAGSGNINEPSHAITSEVRIGDITDPTDINIYRELAGGTTTSHVLHGSANPIGGQSQLIKHRWGGGAEALKFAGAVPSIKFALGENVKQSNWGMVAVPRYPQTRMGVEQLLNDAFVQAAAYAKAHAATGGAPQRRDLRLEALAEILAHQRYVHIHSYRADEILMFARLSQRLGFKVAAFQHVLEGYKVADALAEVGAGASTFSDWWGFKMEAYDAIPYNAAIMTGQRVITSLNSDSNDLGRRLNTEAGKTVKYGGLTPTQALALVTINPARQLRVDSQVGSIEVGKDADLVLWNHPPLSSYARPQKVWIDGREYFDLQADAAEQQRVAAERANLIQQALAAAPKGPPAGPRGPGQRPKLLVDPGQFRVINSSLAALRGAYHNGEAVHFCQGEQ